MVDKGKQTNRFMANGISRSFKWVTVIHELEPNLFLFGTLSDSLYLYDMKKETVRNLSTELQPDPKFEKLEISRPLRRTTKATSGLRPIKTAYTA